MTIDFDPARETNSVTVVKASDPLLPGEGTFGVSGDGIFKFADGTTATFNINDPEFWIKS